MCQAVKFLFDLSTDLVHLYSASKIQISVMFGLLILLANLCMLSLASSPDSSVLTHRLALRLKAEVTQKLKGVVTPRLERTLLNPLLSHFETISPRIIDLHIHTLEQELVAHPHLNKKSTNRKISHHARAALRFVFSINSRQ